MICFVDYRTTDEECNNLHNLGLKIIKIPKLKNFLVVDAGG